MTQKLRKKRITKVEWYDLGGFANSALFRQQSHGGAWRYYINLDRFAANLEEVMIGIDWSSKPDFTGSSYIMNGERYRK